MKEWLEFFSIPLGIVVQVLRGNGVPTKLLLPGTILVCVFGVWLGAPDDATFKQIARDAVIWTMGTVSTMFSTAYGAYAYAAKGKNSDDRSERAALPLVPVTDPNKEIHPAGSHK